MKINKNMKLVHAKQRKNKYIPLKCTKTAQYSAILVRAFPPKMWYSITRKMFVKGGITMISVTALCNSILKRAFEEAIPVTPMKLQKLLYFIYRDYLQQYGKSLFREDFLTWQYGPVLRSAYDEFKSFHANPIKRFAKDANDQVYVVNEPANPELIGVVNNVWDRYKNRDGVYLSSLTHFPETAWSKAIEAGSDHLKDVDIKDEQIQ